MEDISSKKSAAYRILYHWVRFVFERVYYKRVHRLHTENIPHNNPVILVSNHQNSLLDAFQMLFAVRNTFLHFISRADVFRKKPVARLLYGLGLIPIYRVRDGVEKIKNNLQMFGQVEQYLQKGGMLAIYPEATHMDGNWLGRFYHSYVRIGFETAERSGFEQEVFILPSTLYYEDFFALRSQCMIDFSEPFSLRPFYETYKANPRQTEEEVNAIIRHKIQEKMLDVKDMKNYQTVMDFISYSETAYAEKKQAVDMNMLPQALTVRKEIEEKLSALMENNPEKLQEIYSHTADYSHQLKRFHISDSAFLNPSNIREVIQSALFYLLLSPLYIVGALAHLPMFIITPLATKKLEDKLMTASIDICVWILGIPVFYLVYFILIGNTVSWFFAALLLLMLPALFRFAFGYQKNLKEDFLRFRCRLIRKKRKKSWEKISGLREALNRDLDSIC